MNRFAIVLLAVCSVAAAEDLRMTASEWPPYVAADSYKNGVVMLLTETALERADYNVTEAWHRRHNALLYLP